MIGPRRSLFGAYGCILVGCYNIGWLRVQIIDSVNMFDPMTLFDAFQRALAFEKQNRRVGSSFSPAITGVSSSNNVSVRKLGRDTFSDPEDNDDDVAYGDYEAAPVYDDEPEYEEEYVSGDVGENLVEYDRDITHNGKTNTYSFLFGGVKITLMPNKPKQVVNKPTGTLLTLSQFKDELEMGDDIFVLIGKEVAEEPGLQFHNRTHYKMSLGEHEALRRQISGATIFTKMDLKIGYYQSVLDLMMNERPLSRLMKGCMRGCASFNEHVTHVRQALTLLRKDSFYAATKKCVFMTPKVLFLGYVVSGDGIRVDESKVAAVQEWPTPTTITEVQSFHDLAFQVVKEKLTTTPILVFPDFSKVFELHTDASKVAIGGVISQGG
nr:hypothetical protein [Tanacetum cinerariifolium]